LTPRASILRSSAAVAVVGVWLVVVAAPAVASAKGPASHTRRARFQIPASADQLIVVSSPTYDPAPPGYLATLRTYERASRWSRWRPAFASWRAETGYGHLRDARHEGDGSTPTGVFGIGGTIYGNQPDPGGLRYAYHRLVCGDWWDEDPYSQRYNRFVHVPCGLTPAFASWSEALWTQTVAYPYFAVVQFNANPIRGGSGAPGSGMFLHSWVGGATAGCVALREAQLLHVLRWLEPSAHPVIEIGTNREVDLPPASPA
jgi:L,D-peptidoglycan transpeptidase YkuD (ErfK/YbiS/YcfS/YnhG family)